MRLQNDDWSGKVRELQNAIERAVILSRCGTVKFELPVLENSGTSQTRPLRKTKPGSETEIISEEEMRLREKENISAALEQTNRKIYGSGGGAEFLRLKPTTLLSPIKKMGIQKRGQIYFSGPIDYR